MAKVYKKVDCSVCKEKDIEWNRYECLICDDEYNLCRKCFNDKEYSNEHRPFHPMQLVLDRQQFLRFVNSIVPLKDKLRLTCPICGVLEPSVVDLLGHSQQKHVADDDQVKCPVCVSFGIPAEQSTEQWKLNSHLQEWHRERGEDVICNTCDVDVIKGYRYSCLVCDMYDQCEICFVTKQHDDDHMPYHPIQKVLPKEEYEAQNGSSVKIYRCPFCGEDKFSGTGLAEHCYELHSHSQSVRVRCPICTVCRVPFEEDSILKESLLDHLTNYHGIIPSELQTKPRECNICFIGLNEKVPLQMYCQCTHNSFHEQCIKDWLTNNPTCPICRAKRVVNRID